MGFSGSLDEDGGGSSRAGFGIPCGKPTAAAEPPNATRGCAPAAVQCFFVIVVRDPNAIIELSDIIFPAFLSST